MQQRVAALCGALGDVGPILESYAEGVIRARKGSLLEQDNGELHTAEPRAEERVSVLCVQEV
jgi:hypothetical protein